MNSYFFAAMVFMLVSCTNANQSAEAGKADEVVMANDSKNKSNIMVTQKITPYLWVEKDAKAVADYYLSIFKDGKLKDFRRFDSSEAGNDAGIETAVIEIAGMEFSILAAGPLFKDLIDTGDPMEHRRQKKRREVTLCVLCVYKTTC